MCEDITASIGHYYSFAVSLSVIVLYHNLGIEAGENIITLLIFWQGSGYSPHFISPRITFS
jgi:hypothetical protein